MALGRPTVGLGDYGKRARPIWLRHRSVRGLGLAEAQQSCAPYAASAWLGVDPGGILEGCSLVRRELDYAHENN